MLEPDFQYLDSNGITLARWWRAMVRWSSCCTAGRSAGICGVTRLRHWNAITPELEKARFTQPAAFVAGSEDDVLLYDPHWRESFPQDFDDLRLIDIVAAAGHWLQLEKPAETTAQMLRFLRAVEPR